MRLIQLTSILVLSQMPFVTYAWSDTSPSLQQCATIEDSSARLACFDNLAQQSVNLISSSPEKTVNSHNLEQQAPQTLPTQKLNVVNDGTSQETEFGKPTKGPAITSISSTIAGEFRGWIKGAVITLSNDQKWRVVSDSKGYTRLTDPEVVIEQGVFNSYTMRVSGFTPLAKVRRIE